MSPFATDEDASLFHGLKDDVKVLVHARIAAFAPYLRAKHGTKGPAIEEAAVTLGLSFDQAETLAGAYRKHGWRGLVDRKKAGPEFWRRRATVPTVGSNAAFIQEWQEIVVLHKRATLPAWRALIRKWKAWRNGDTTKAIKGYPYAPPMGASGEHPTGWSYENLLRFLPSQEALVGGRIGTAAMIGSVISIPGTREGMRPLEFVAFDDIWHDRKGMVPRFRIPLRFMQITALDVACCFALKLGVKPEIPNAEGGMTRLKEKDTWFLIVQVLQHYGYPLDYPMWLIVERATATVRAADAKMLYEVSGGQIRVCYTDMEGGLYLAWQESAAGNPNGKGWIEAWNLAFHYEMSGSKGYIGHNPDNAPESLPAQERYAERLAVLSSRLSPEQAARLRFPFASQEDCTREAFDAAARLNARGGHAIEGFGRTPIWRVKGQNMEWLSTPPPEGMAGDLVEWTTRLESPAERFERLSRGVRFGRLPAHAIEQLLVETRELGVIKGLGVRIRAEGKYVTYAPTREDPLPKDGTKVLVAVNPQDPGIAYVTSGDGRWIGAWKRIVGGRANADAKEAIATRNDLIARAHRETLQLVGPQIQAAEDDRRENLALLRDAGVLPIDATAPDEMTGALIELLPAPATAQARLSTAEALALPGFAGALQAPPPARRKAAADQRLSELAESSLAAAAARKPQPSSPYDDDDESY